MAIAANPLIPVDGQIVITDGAALTFTLAYEDGDFQCSGLNGNSQKSVQSFKSRGKTYAVRQVEDQDISFQFTAHVVGIIGDGTTALIGDVVLRKGVWASYTSKISASQGDANLLQVKWQGERTNFGAAADSSLTFKYCYLELDFSEGVPGKVSVKGTAFPISTDYLTIV